MSRQNKNYANIYGSSVKFEKLFINPKTKVITVLIGDGTFELVELYSQIKDIWMNDETLIKYSFPMLMVTRTETCIINDWTLIIKS